MSGTEPSGNLPDEYSRLSQMLAGIPEALTSPPYTKTKHGTLGVGGSVTYVVQTIRTYDAGKSSDWLLVQVIAAKTERFVIPPEVTEAIARQRDGLTDRRRVLVGKRTAAARAKRGEQPAFMTKRPKAPKKARRS